MNGKKYEIIDRGFSIKSLGMKCSGQTVFLSSSISGRDASAYFMIGELHILSKPDASQKHVMKLLISNSIVSLAKSGYADKFKNITSHQ
jgi:hypothetical protein